ncbi:DHH family phosphoesterase [Isachenkonia alkalipeptolytica]|nr:bifunctional oligoribonuclease/PAP phosphatase NrnA [Isachenkonia alkalipeptolytica]
MISNIQREIQQAIEKAKTIALISHKSPDGDSLGSVAGLGQALMETGKEVTLFINDKIPERYEFLAEKNPYRMYKKGMGEGMDLVFVLDCGQASRLDYSEGILNEGKVIINMDHHMKNPDFGHINWVNTEISSTCELVLELIRKLKLPLNHSVATALYTGIVTDTGSFMYDNTAPGTLRACAELLEAGVDKDRIYREVFQSRNLREVKLLGEVLKDLTPLFEGRVTLSSLSQQTLKNHDLDIQSLDELIDFTRDIAGVEISVVLKEMENGGTKIGFRSKGEYRVDSLARSFGGGGHEKAAGATVKTDLEETETSVKKALEELLK